MNRIQKVAIGMAGLLAMLVPMTSFAERPEIDCNSLSEDVMQKFYDISGQCASLTQDKQYEEAFRLCNEAMSMCTTDVYTEYTLGRLYQLTDDCANAYYHFEILTKKPESVQKENADVYKELKNHFKTIKKKCGDLATLEIICETPDVELTINGLGGMTNYKCPYFGKVKPGSYPIIATKSGHQSFKTTANVSTDTGASVAIPALKESAMNGLIRVTCPKGSTKFIVTNSKGEVTEYLCPYEMEVPPDTYKIRLSNTDPGSEVELVVGPKDRKQFAIPAAPKSSCSAAPAANTATHAGGLLAILAALGFAFARRRRQQ